MSIVISCREKTCFCICENKGADQLCHIRIADQHLSFRYMDCTIPLHPYSEISSLAISPFCRKPQRQVFLPHVSFVMYICRADLEELQCLWSEVRKELSKLEEHLSFRLSSVLSGNDNFSPLSAMEIVSSVSVKKWLTE